MSERGGSASVDDDPRDPRSSQDKVRDSGSGGDSDAAPSSYPSKGRHEHCPLHILEGAPSEESTWWRGCSEGAPAAPAAGGACRHCGRAISRMEVGRVVEWGQVTDWDMVEKIWDYAVDKHLRVDTRDHPVLLSEKVLPLAAARSGQMTSRHKYAELMFEKYGAPALFLAKDAVLSCFALGRSTGLVVYFGHHATTAAPVFDGWLEVGGVVSSVVCLDGE